MTPEPPVRDSPDLPGPSTLPPSQAHSRVQTPADSPPESTRVSPALDGDRGASTPSETTVPAAADRHYKALMENVRKEFRLLGEAHAGHTERFERAEAKHEQDHRKLQHQIIAVDVKLTKKIDTVDAKLTRKIDTVDAKLTRKIERLHSKIDTVDKKVDSLDRKLDQRFDVFSAELSRIAKHLGLHGAPRPARRR